MTTVLAIHSHSGGTGKSVFAVNIAAVLASRGRHVCLVDTDVQAPGLHVLLGIAEPDVGCALSDYVLGRCELMDAVRDVSHRLAADAAGRLTLVPSRLDAAVIAEIVGGGYDAGMLDDAFGVLTDTLKPDVLVLDTQAGMTNETMVALAAADVAVILMRDDEQEYRGAAVSTAVIHKINSPRTVVIVNMVGEDDDVAHVRALAEAAYGCNIEAVIRYATEIADRASDEVFVVAHPDHPLTTRLTEIAESLVADHPH